MDNLFRTAQLIALQSHAEVDGHAPIPLQIARLAVPIATALATFNILIGSITRPARLALLAQSSGHIVLCGSDSFTESALLSLLSRGQQIVMAMATVSPARREILEGLGVTVLEGDLYQPTMIKALHLSHASALFVTSDDDVLNLNVATIAWEAVAQRPIEMLPLVLSVKIEDDILAEELDVALKALSPHKKLRFNRISADREGVRLELRHYAPVFLKADLNHQSHILIIGLAGNWQQIAMQLVIAGQDHPEHRPLLTFLVDDHEEAKVKRWYETRAELSLVADVITLIRRQDAPLPPEEAATEWRQQHGPAHIAVILMGNADAIAAALTLRRPENCLGTETIPVLVRQSQEDRFLTLLGENRVDDRDTTRMVAIGGLIRAESVGRVLDKKGEEIAMGLHVHYLRLTAAHSSEALPASSLADASPADEGTPQRKTATLDQFSASKPWDDLPEMYRGANRATAEHAPILLAAGGYRLIPNGAAPAVCISGLEIEMLGRIEHRRWMADRIDNGWRYHATRNDRKRLHPSLVAYDELNEAEREKDRNSVRVLLQILTEQSYSIVSSRSAEEDCLEPRGPNS